ncbi:MAG: hypothetical protein C4533_06245 [Candidatus Omnitrophota bacterium]|jgi:hypothetical protein|nr:MAG: hypothetical protein C4533_06245 [Candidatus Omnitrophota bacterium]
MHINKKGITLIASVFLIVLASILILSLSFFIVQRLSQGQTEIIKTKTIYSANAGINSSAYWFRFHDLTANGYFTLGQTNTGSQDYFVLGGDAADLLMLNTINSFLASSNRNLEGLTMQNATNSSSITIDRMIVTWNNNRRLRVIGINGSNVWTGNSASPADCNISNFTLNTTPTIYSINYLQFNNSMTGATISIQFVMTDGSSKTLTAYPASNNYNFTVKSTGKTTGSSFYRTVQAEYNALTSKFIDYDEIYTQITP